MALRVFGDEAAGFSLHDGNDTRIGWIMGRAMGFRCFAELAEARIAARLAYEALAAWSSRFGILRPLTEIDDGELHIVNDGAHEWFASGRVPVARLLRPAADLRVDDDECFGIELVIPQGIGAVAAISGAQVAHYAITRGLEEAAMRDANEVDDDVHADDDAADFVEA